MVEALLALILAGVALGEVPFFHFNRATLALVGAVVVLVLGVIPLNTAYHAIDLNTLALLFAMMVFTAHLRLAGFFELAGQTLARFAHSPRSFLGLVILAGALFSALFINDTVVLLFTPLVAQLTLALELDPLPYLMGLAVSANIGSMMTPIGNPQNILIATSSGLGFKAFASELFVPGVLSLGLSWLLLSWTYRHSLRRRPLRGTSLKRIRVHKALLAKSGLALALMIGGFLLGWPLALAALAGSALLLVTRRVKPVKILAKIDGTLLLFFAALFIITRAVESTGGFQALLAWSRPVLAGNWALFSAVSALLSNLISNVPAVMVLKPLIPTLADPSKAWLALAAASTLAGNLTLLGSVANLIVAETARPYGIKLTFWEYLKTGLPLAILSIALTAGWLTLPYFAQNP